MAKLAFYSFDEEDEHHKEGPRKPLKKKVWAESISTDDEEEAAAVVPSYKVGRRSVPNGLGIGKCLV